MDSFYNNTRHAVISEYPKMALKLRFVVKSITSLRTIVFRSNAFVCLFGGRLCWANIFLL